MDNWKKYWNYRKRLNTDGSFVYFITIDGEDVEVSETVYREYASLSRKMKYLELDLKRNRVKKDSEGNTAMDEHGLPFVLPERETSLDQLIDEDWEFPSTEQSPEIAFIDAEGSDMMELYRCIALLTEDEYALIDALFFNGFTERDYAEKLGIRQQSINGRKRRILEKLKKLFDKPC